MSSSKVVTISSSAQNPNSCTEEKPSWWPGLSVFRLIVSSETGRKFDENGEVIKKICDETGAQIDIFKVQLNDGDRIVLIHGKEEPTAWVSPAMAAVIQVFKRAIGCSARLLLPIEQAKYIIGKEGHRVKSIEFAGGALVDVLTRGRDEVPSYVPEDQRVVRIRGSTPKVVKTLEEVLSRIRHFLVHPTVIPLYEKQFVARSICLTYTHGEPSSAPSPYYSLFGSPEYFSPPQYHQPLRNSPAPLALLTSNQVSSAGPSSSSSRRSYSDVVRGLGNLRI